MSARVVVDGLANEPANARQVDELLVPILDLLGGIKRDDVESLTITGRAIRAKVVVRTKRGRRIARSWAHVEVAIADDYEEGDDS